VKECTIDDDDDSRSYVRPLLHRNSHERASDTPLQTVQFSDHDGTRISDDSCVSVLKEFQVDGPATAKLRGPYRSVLVAGTARSVNSVIN